MSDADFVNRYGPWAVIAGGSEGIGSAFAERLAAQGINVVGIAVSAIVVAKWDNALDTAKLFPAVGVRAAQAMPKPSPRPAE